MTETAGDEAAADAEAGAEAETLLAPAMAEPDTLRPVELVVVDPAAPGAATAVEGSTSAPIPHGMASPSGWVAV